MVILNPQLSQVRQFREEDGSRSLSAPVDCQLRKKIRTPISTLFGILRRKADANADLPPECRFDSPIDMSIGKKADLAMR